MVLVLIAAILASTYNLMNCVAGAGLPAFGLAVANLIMGLGLCYLLLGYGTQTGALYAPWLPG